MNYRISFQERARLGLEELSRQIANHLKKGEKTGRAFEATERFREQEKQNVLTRSGILYFVDTIFI